MSLPIGASRLNWIQSTGTQYLDTQFQPNSNTKVVIDFQAENFSRNIFGARKGWKNDAFALHWNDAGASAVQINDSAIAIAASYTDFLRHTVEMTASSLTIDGSVAASYSSGTFETGKSMYIALANGAESDGFWQGKIYSCQIYDNGTLVRDYIPCKLADGSVGLWDDVEGKFYGNAGTGAFTAGPVVSEIVDESEITELEYIESTGTQYVDTLFKPNNNTRVVMDVELPVQGSYPKGLFGVRDATSGNKNSFLMWVYNQSFNTGFATVGKAISLTTSGRFTVDKNKTANIINGTTYSADTASTFQSSYSLLLLALMNSNGVDSRMVSGKLYSCQIYDNGTLVRDYIPAKTIEGEVGLYDRVFKEFYRNAGTGAFIAGPEKVFAPKAPANFRVVSESDAEVALAWDASESAAGYRLYKDGILLADTTDLAYTDTAEPFGTYTYTVKAYNEYGVGESAELVVFLSPDNPILWLVTDRTQADVTARNSKGVYQAVDLNRVGAAVEYLRKRLLNAGILADVSPRMDWTDIMWMSASEARVYLNNVKAMRAALAMPKGTPAAPDDMAKLTYAEANHMEMFLVILDALLTDMVFAYRHCGTTVCGMGGLIL